MGELILKRASASRPSGEWKEDDFDVLADSAVVGRIFKVPKPDRRRALELLASGRDGYTEAIMMAHGFTIQALVRDRARRAGDRKRRARGRRW
jgi:hypothetical protein